MLNRSMSKTNKVKTGRSDTYCKICLFQEYWLKDKRGQVIGTKCKNCGNNSLKNNQTKSCCCLSYERGISPCICNCHLLTIKDK